ncbi:MAG: hypothetical protein QW145_05095 [Candidatus Bathyarchaeia archaeon]
MSEQTRTKLLGDFGEYLLAWLLRSRFGVNLSLVKTEGVDLLCVDKDGALFPKNENIAISVRTRERTKERVLDNVNADWSKIEDAAERWNAKPYFAYVRITPENGEIKVFLLPVTKAKTYGRNFNVKKAELDPSNILFEMKFEQYVPKKQS